MVKWVRTSRNTVSVPAWSLTSACQELQRHPTTLPDVVGRDYDLNPSVYPDCLLKRPRDSRCQFLETVLRALSSLPKTDVDANDHSLESLSGNDFDKAHDSSATKNPMVRVGQMQELRNLATVLMADGCDYLTGETIVIDGGAFLDGGGGNFWQLSHLGDQDWENIRNTIKIANEKDKAKRTA